jgi:hypothetical protein
MLTSRSVTDGVRPLVSQEDSKPGADVGALRRQNVGQTEIGSLEQERFFSKQSLKFSAAACRPLPYLCYASAAMRAWSGVTRASPAPTRQFRQKARVNRTRTVNSSSRPSSMANDRIHLAASGKLEKLPIGPTMGPSPGPTFASAVIELDIAVK